MAEPSTGYATVLAPRDRAALTEELLLRLDPTGDQGVIYRNDRTVVRRLGDPAGGGSVVVKQALGPAARERTRHEQSLLRRLGSVPGVPRLLAPDRDDLLVLEDAGQRTLRQALSGRPLRPAAALRLLLKLARITAAVHAAGVMHRDLNPVNVVVRPGADGEIEPTLVDFDLATTYAQVRPSFVDARDIVGRLSYLAPEQTGRTGLPVDQRADLYALGAVLYELVSGAPPFHDDNPLDLVRDILTRTPRAPVTVEGPLPPTVWQLLARLLEKEPDARYQSASGLVHDLTRLVTGADADIALGSRDFPVRLSPPTRLVGRDRESRRLAAALERAATGGGVRAVLVGGDPGVGKSVLINGLRPVVAARGGWFLTGKADQYHREATTSLFTQTMGALGRLLLAEPQVHLDRWRVTVTRSLGENAGLIAGLVPEFQRLLGIDAADAHEDDGDPATEARLRQAAADLLRPIVSPQRPLVLFLDDLQWAGTRMLRLMDALVTDTHLSGLLVVGAYRDGSVDVAHPLSAMRERWARLPAGLTQVHLRNLTGAHLAGLLAEMLRIPPREAAALADVLAERTGGNPFDTVELVNALRRDGALVLGEAGWSWDAATIRHYVGPGDVVDLLHDRVRRLPGPSREVLHVMARLGSDVDVRTLGVAADLPPGELLNRLTPALEDGLLIAEGGNAGATAVRFRHDRVQQAVHEGLGDAALGRLGLVLARRLAAAGHAAEAARQYLPVVDALRHPEEQRDVVRLFQQAASGARRSSDPAVVESYLHAAWSLHQRAGGREDDATARSLDVSRHAALYTLGRLAEADALFGRIAAHSPRALDLVPAACVQIPSLTNRGRLREALDLGLDLLAALGLPLPEQGPHDRPGAARAAVVAAGYDRMERWIAARPAEHDLAHPEVTDPRARALAQVLSRLCSPAYFTDHLLLGWLVCQAHALWAQYGPQAALVPCLGHANARALGLRPTMGLDRSVVRHALGVGQARGYQAVMGVAHFLHAVVMAHWFQPLEEVVAEARSARETLIQVGDPTYGCYAFYPSTYGLLDCAPTLESVEAETAAALALASRTGNDHITESLVWYRQLAFTLRGRALEGFDAEATLRAIETTNPMAVVYCHITRAIAAAVDGDLPRVARALAAADPVQVIIAGTYSSGLLPFLRGLVAVHDLRTATGEAGAAAALARLDDCRRALHRFSVPAPMNFRHLALLLDAERAAACGDDLGALAAFDGALAAVDAVVRPWHSALISERAAAFHVDRGWTRSGRRLLADARRQYLDWGAVAKVRALDREHPGLRGTGPVGEASPSMGGSGLHLTADSMDMLAVLAASQAISSQTDPNQLQAVLADHLRSLTGATTVRLVVCDPESGEWSVQPERVDDEPLPVEQAAGRGDLPLSVVEYARRTNSPLLVANAAEDDRFARDPYVSARERCSVLAVPILHAGTERAVLVLVNDLGAGAFTTDRLDAVQLLAGQLAVTLDNVLLYRSLEAKVTARTRDLQAAKQQLEVLSITDPLTQVANRRRFESVLASEWASAQAARRPMAIAMIDLDHFKQYNDRLGHLAGDQCLQLVARTIEAAVGPYGLVARYGGEEFAVILPGAIQVRARDLAEGMRRAVQALALPHPDGGRVSISVGVAVTVPDPAAPSRAQVAAADAALYRAKHAGRDRVAVAAPPQFWPR